MPSSSAPKRRVYAPLVQLPWRRITPWLAAALALALYVQTAAPGLTWAHHGADGGDFVAATMTWGVPHPSGYPTFVLLARLFALLPLGDLARRFNLFSATMAALAVASTAVVIQRILAKSSETGTEGWPVAAGGLGALVLAASPALWSQAIITEVYTLHLALVASVLVVATTPEKWSATRWFALGLLAGVGLGNHLTLGLALPGIATLCWRKLDKRRWWVAAAGGLLGLCVYLYVPLAARRQPPVSWGDASTARGFWWLVSGSLYHRYAIAAGWPQVWQRTLALMGLWRDQFGLLGVALTFLGLWSWIEQRRWRLLSGMGSICLLTLAYAITYDTPDSMLYLLPCYLVGVLWIASGVGWLAETVTAETKLAQRWSHLAAVVLLVAIPCSRVARWYGTLDLSSDHEAEAWLEEALAIPPANAVLITAEDRHTFALWYALYAQDRRPDLLVVDADLYVEPWYRAQVGRQAGLQGDPPSSVASLIEILASDRPVYLGTNRLDLARLSSLSADGVLWRLTE